MLSLLTDISTDRNSMCISPYGSGISSTSGESETKWALGFRGSPEFIERCYNLCHNRGIISLRSRLHWYYLDGNCLGYVIVRSRERILKGIAAQFRSEIIMGEEIKPLSESFDEETGEYDVEFDDPAIDRLAAQRAGDFVAEHIPQESFMARIEQSVIDSYEVGTMHDGSKGGDQEG